MIIETTLLQILVTVWLHKRPIMQRLPKEYPVTTDACIKDANRILDRAKKGVKVGVICVPALTRSA